VALMFALTINASLLVLAAATFYKSGQVVGDLNVAHGLLSPLLGSAIAPVLFGIALLCCGLNSTVTATMAGQIVMEGFIDIKMAAWARRLVTRLVAIIPAIAVILLAGEAQLGKLLVLSQVVLSFQLPFAVVPLGVFTASKAKLGELVAPRWLTVMAATIATLLISLNVKLIFDFLTGAL
jgi:manganese transport protein